MAGQIDLEPALGQLREQLEKALAEIDSLHAELTLAKAHIRELEAETETDKSFFLGCATEAITLGELERALADAWSRETSSDPVSWSEANPAWGQCAVTALIVQDYFGGSLRRGEVDDVSHYWNVLPSGEEIDLTKHQFSTPVEITNVAARSRDYILSNPETRRRYRTLARSVGRSFAPTHR